MESLEELITNKKFDSYRVGLESRFAANKLTFEFTYTGPEGGSALRARLEKKEKIAEVCVWESGHLNLELGDTEKETEDIESYYWKTTDSNGFHDALAAGFLFVTGKGDYKSSIQKIDKN
ncbi:hypothetical protein [Pelagicoccus sp. SDUM812003]|uniref:hypothetical protein n=1 Tax=Pelagicoccus sp. SDUM812003 TaxID=3041267 RepID=UPI0028103CF1|nr:hypothetical protein [Pelagicoccus sp. SDUM812003]MDQ8205835.1 hypothetical protein [Pelagicoccus sp. SDUM812003]